MSKLAKMLAWEKLTPEQRAAVQEIKNSFADKIEVKDTTKTTFSPSALGWGSGKCPRRWYFLFNGAETVETLTAESRYNMQNGTDLHEITQGMLEDNPNLKIDIEVEVKNEDPPIRGFIDGVINADGDPIILEIKSAKDVAYGYRETSFEAAAYHKLQVSIYMALLKSKLGLFFYLNKNSYDNLIIPFVMDDKTQAYVDYLFDWMRTTRKAFEENTLPNYFAGKRSNSKVCSSCPVKKVCDQAGEVRGGVDIPLLELPE